MRAWPCGPEADPAAVVAAKGAMKVARCEEQTLLHRIRFVARAPCITARAPSDDAVSPTRCRACSRVCRGIKAEADWASATYAAATLPRAAPKLPSLWRAFLADGVGGGSPDEGT